MNRWLKKKRIMRRYDLTAGMYDMRYADEQKAKIKAALRHIKLKRSGSVLDVGCGSGLLFDSVAKKVNSVTGLDFSKQILLEARKRKESYANVNLVQADADFMPFKNEVFNHVFALTVIQNIPSPEASLSEMKRVATTNAEFVVTGLKKIFSKCAFKRLIDMATLSTHALENDDLKCYVAVCTYSGP